MVNYTRFVEVGRVVYITKGSHQKKLAVIVDIIDQNRVLIDGPCTGVPRRPINLKRVHLTNIVVKLPKKCGTLGVQDNWFRQKVDKQWKKTEWARKIERKRIRAGLNDFQRFQVMVARKTVRFMYCYLPLIIMMIRRAVCLVLISFYLIFYECQYRTLNA